MHRPVRAEVLARQVLPLERDGRRSPVRDKPFRRYLYVLLIAKSGPATGGAIQNPKFSGQLNVPPEGLARHD
ncbi:hypothetical protein ACRAQ7_11060 [Erythrobacter sp. W53]|uniref:hypothetical protein n=1 Tax=Erythrobacter sp. W53 TaxID=3425947 RepID=UPI003D766BAB